MSDVLLCVGGPLHGQEVAVDRKVSNVRIPKLVTYSAARAVDGEAVWSVSGLDTYEYRRLQLWSGRQPVQVLIYAGE